MALSDWAPEIVSLEDEEEVVNLMIYGAAGSGKTVFAGSAKRVLFLAPEDDGTISAKRQGSQAKKWPVNSFSDLVEALDRLEDHIDEVKEDFDWICIDSITRMQKETMRQILEDAVELDPQRDPDIPQMQDWQKYQNMFLRVVQAFNDLPINILWTALVRTEEDEEGDDFLVPDIQGKGYQMAMTVASYMTSYGYLKNKEVIVKRNGDIVKDEDGEPKKRIVREIIWRDTGVVRGKDRTDVLSPSTKDLTLEQIHQLIKGEKTREDFLRKPPAAKAPVKKAAPRRATVEKPAENEAPAHKLADAPQA